MDNAPSGVSLINMSDERGETEAMMSRAPL